MFDCVTYNRTDILVVSLSSPSIEVAFNKLLRKIWNLPYNSHTGIVHCTAKIHSVSNMLYDRFCSLHSFALSSSSSLIQSIFVSSTQHIYYIHGYTHYYFEEFHAAFIIRCLRSTYMVFIHHVRILYSLCPAANSVLSSFSGQSRSP